MREVRPVSDRRSLRDFIDLPYRLYRDDPNWAPPLRIERRLFFDRSRNPFFDHGEASYFVCYREGKPVGRITAHVDYNYDDYHHTRHGFFGFFECEKDPEAAQALIGAAEQWLRERGYERIIGPMNFTTNQDTPGFLIEGAERPSYLMNPHTMPYYPDFFTAAGYETEQRLLSWVLTEPPDLPPEFRAMEEKLFQRYGDRLVVRHIDLKHLRRDVDIMLAVFNDAWKENWGYVPMTGREITAMADELKLIADPRITYIVEKDGEAVSFMVGIPNINQLLLDNRSGTLFSRAFFRLLFRRRTITQFRVLLMGVLKKYRLLGLDTVMYHRLFRDAVAAGYREVEMSWILENNTPMNQALARMGARIFQKYLIMGKDIRRT